MRNPAQVNSGRPVTGLKFIAIDPDTNGDHCPAVFADEETGDLLFQGWTVTDPAALAQVGGCSRIADNESVVRLPARAPGHPGDRVDPDRVRRGTVRPGPCSRRSPVKPVRVGGRPVRGQGSCAGLDPWRKRAAENERDGEQAGTAVPWIGHSGRPGKGCTVARLITRVSRVTAAAVRKYRRRGTR